MDVPPSQRELLSIAKEQLGLHDIVHVPADYVEVLRRHTELFPNDTHFVLSPQPGEGFGFATCLEEGCNYINIPLTPLTSLPDGGKAIGIGSLSAYSDHICSTPAHIRSRNDRLRYMETRVEPGMMSSPPTTPARSRILNGMDSDQEVTTPTKFGSSPIRPIGYHMSGLAVKNEPVEATIPRKRPSDVALTRLPSPFPGVKSEESSSDKKPRLDALKERLIDDPFNSLPASSSSAAVEDTRAKLADTISKIASVQTALQKVRRKSKLSKADNTRMAKLEESLKELTAQRQAFSASIPSAAKPLSRTSTAVKPASFVKTEPVKTEPVASGSNVKLAVTFQNSFDRLTSATVDVKPITPLLSQPVASGSNVKLEAVLPTTAAPVAAKSEDYYSDDDYEPEGGYDSDHWNVHQMPAAKADDIDKFLVAAGNSEQFDGNESVDKALEKLNLPNLYQPLPGMQVALMPHQAIGVAWMLEKERNPAMRGGILADEMGLGKTVQMISVIAINPPTNPARKSTLIVCPVALLDQWQQEIDLKTDLNLSCLIYHGNNKPKRATEISKYDIVLTTFHTLAYEWPDLEAEEKERVKKMGRKQDAEGKPRKKRGSKKELGKLFLIDWYRIVIDEAQSIRNRRTRVSRAIAELESTYRWCLTGTPIINTLSDAYGLLRFLRIRPWYDWTEFNGRIARFEKKEPSLASIRLQAIFKTTLLRRKKDSELDGKKLIELPPKEVTIRKLEFTPEEREIYSMVEAKAQATFNRFLRAGTVLKNYHHVFATLLRLRQICAHPVLIQEQGDEDGFLHADEIGGDRDSELARAARLVSVDFVTRMKQKFKDIVTERMAAERIESDDATIDGEECPICYDVLTDAIVTRCSHVFCRECITNVLNAAAHHDANEPDQYKADERPCPSCRGAISKNTIFSRQAFEPTEEELTGKTVVDEDIDMGDDTSEPDVKGKGKAPAGRVLRRRTSRPMSIVDSEDEEDDDPDDDLSDFIVDDDEDEEEADARIARNRATRRVSRRAIVVSDDEGDDEGIIYGAKPSSAPVTPEKAKKMSRFLPSTKMKYMMDSLKAWAETHPEEKVMIISQWTQCLDLVSKYLIENGFVHVKYQGSMTRNQRDASVRSFMAKEKATVMLMSLKCGGVGLNLTRANRVISLDLGWSEAIESQAFDRVHRLGQTRTVTVDRLVIQNTIEDRILALQENKRNLADGSLGEGNGKKIGRLTVKQLASLFNMDTRGNILT